jgi:hypothetical protein
MPILIKSQAVSIEILEISNAQILTTEWAPGTEQAVMILDGRNHIALKGECADYIRLGLIPKY